MTGVVEASALSQQCTAPLVLIRQPDIEKPLPVATTASVIAAPPWYLTKVAVAVSKHATRPSSRAAHGYSVLEPLPKPVFAAHAPLATGKSVCGGVVVMSRSEVDGSSVDTSSVESTGAGAEVSSVETGAVEPTLGSVEADVGDPGALVESDDDVEGTPGVGVGVIPGLGDVEGTVGAPVVGAGEPLVESEVSPGVVGTLGVWPAGRCEPPSSPQAVASRARLVVRVAAVSRRQEKPIVRSTDN